MILNKSHQNWKNSRSLESRFEVIGLLYCACGEKMYSVSGQRKGKPRRDYYRCKTSHCGKGCGRKHAERETLHHTINSFVQEHLANTTTVLALLQNARKQERIPDTRKAEAETRRLQAEQARLLQFAVQGLFSQDHVDREARRITSDLAAWQEILNKAAAATARQDTQTLTTAAEHVATVLAEFAYLAPYNANGSWRSCLPELR